jgi:hypothetical protein
MTMLLIALVLTVAVVAGVEAMRRTVANDGGPRAEPLPHTDQDWHPALPSRPYATKH